MELVNLHPPGNMAMAVK